MQPEPPPPLAFANHVATCSTLNIDTALAIDTRVSSVGTASADSRTELDSHTNIVVFGRHIVVINETGQDCRS